MKSVYKPLFCNILENIMKARRIAVTTALSALALTLLLSLAASPVMAATETWLGASGAAMATGANWKGTDTPPNSGDSLVFATSSASGLDLNNNLTSSSFNIAGMTFTAGAPAFVIGDGTSGDLNAGNAFVLTGSVANNGTSLETINNPFSMTAVQTFATTAGGGNLSLGGSISGAGGITTSGAGILTLSGTNGYSGATTLTAGTLAVGSAGVLSPNSGVVFNGSSTLNLGGGPQTVNNLNYGTTTTSQTSSITNGSLTVTGATGLTLAPSGATTLNMGGLTSFTYNQPGQAVTMNAYDGAAADTLTVNLPTTGAGQSTITASSINVALTSAVGTAFAPVNLNLGTSNTFNTTSLIVGGYRGEGNVAFAAGLTSPTLTLRGAAGGFTPVTMFQDGLSESGLGLDTCTFDTSGGSGIIDAIITTAYVSIANTEPAAATWSVANGTINVGTLSLSCGTNTNATTSTGTMNQKAGTALVGTLNFGYNSSSGNYTLTSAYNLGTGTTSALLSAGSLIIGGGGRATASAATLTFNNGTIENYEPAFAQGGSANAQGGSSTQNLTISGLSGGGAAGSSNTLNIVLAGSNAHNFYAESGYSITEQSTALISGSGGLTANGPGTVVLAGSNTYTGNTLVSNGTLTLSNNSAIQNSALNTSGTGAVALTVTTPTIGGLIGSTNLSSVMTSGYSNVTALTLNPGAGAYYSYSGVISDGQAPMALVLTGSGTQVLAGPNTYTGSTTISSGVLSIATTAALPGWNLSGSYSVAPGAALAITNAVPDSAIPAIVNANNFGVGAALGFDTTAGNRTYAGTLINTSSGALGLSVLGGNSLTLTASNLYTGPTTISGGSLQIGNGTIDGSIATSSGITNNSSLVFNVAASQNYGNVISGSGALNVIGAGLLSLTGSNTYSGPTTIGGGTLQLGTGASGQDGSLATSGVSNNATLAFNLGGSQTAAYSVSGSGSVVKTGSGTLTLAASQNYTGSTVIQGGTLKLSGVPLGTPINVAFQNATVNGYTGTGPLGTSGTAAWNVFASGAANSAAITTDTLSNLVNASSASVAGTKLSITAGSAGVFTEGGATIPLFDSYADTKTSVTFSLSGLATQQYTVYAISGFQGRSGNFTIGSGTNSVGAAGNLSSFVAGSNYTSFAQVVPTNGAITVTAAPTTSGNEFDFSGLQFVPDAGPLPNTTALSIAAGSTLDLNGLSQTVASLSDFSGSGGTVTSSAALAMTLTLAPTSSTTFSGLLQNGSGTLGLAINGVGTQVLAGNNTYSGGTTLKAGTLNFANVGALGAAR